MTTETETQTTTRDRVAEAIFIQRASQLNMRHDNRPDLVKTGRDLCFACYSLADGFIAEQKVRR